MTYNVFGRTLNLALFIYITLGVERTFILRHVAKAPCIISE